MITQEQFEIVLNKAVEQTKLNKSYRPDLIDLESIRNYFADEFKKDPLRCFFEIGRKTVVIIDVGLFYLFYSTLFYEYLKLIKN